MPRDGFYTCPAKGASPVSAVKPLRRKYSVLRSTRQLEGRGAGPGRVDVAKDDRRCQDRPFPSATTPRLRGHAFRRLAPPARNDVNGAGPAVRTRLAERPPKGLEPNGARCSPWDVKPSRHRRRYVDRRLWCSPPTGPHKTAASPWAPPPRDGVRGSSLASLPVVFRSDGPRARPAGHLQAPLSAPSAVSCCYHGAPAVRIPLRAETAQQQRRPRR